MAASAGSGSPAVGAGRLKVGQRVWLHRDGRAVMGVGTRELLCRVDSTGSLHRAASDMGMAYSKAWLSIRRAEVNLGVPLLVRHTGGKGGGGSTLSGEGRWLVDAFGAFVEEADHMLESLSAKHLGNWPPSGRGLTTRAAGSPVLDEGR